MEFLGFTLSVWFAILLGVLFLALVATCAFDRRGTESPKWFVVVLTLVVLVIATWGDVSWAMFKSPTLWKNVGMYLGVGAAYSLIEFVFAIRRERQVWAETWGNFKASYAQRDPRHIDTADPQAMEREFAASRSHIGTLVNVRLEGTRLCPYMNTTELSQSLACWTVFWPAYAISLALDDLLVAVCRRVADVVAFLSRGIVRRLFANTFSR